MADFARFCPVCYAYFSDPDLYAKHVATCGKVQKTDESKAVKETAADSGNEDVPVQEPEQKTSEDVPAEKPKTTKSKK